MNLNKKFCGYWALFLILFFILVNGCKTPPDFRPDSVEYTTIDIASKWRDKDIVIDANYNEWQDCKQYSDEKTQTSIGIYNDNDYVYMCFSTKDQGIWTGIVNNGFIVWFNQEGNRDKELGVRYPIEEKKGVPDEYNVSESQLQILTSEKDTGKSLSLEDADKLNIYSRIAIDRSGKIVYKLKMPLKKTTNTPYAVVPSKNNRIGIGFITVKVTIDSKTGSTSSGSDGGSAQGRSGQGRSGQGRSRGGLFNMSDDRSFSSKGGGDSGSSKSGGGSGNSKSSHSTSSFEVWANVTLALD